MKPPLEDNKTLKQYHQIVEQFYRENEHLISPAQYKAALEDIEYFARLVILAEHYHKDCNL